MIADIAGVVHAVDAAAVMAQLPNRPRVLALGEPTHNEEELLALRNALFRQLVEQEGYRTIALEIDCIRALIVDDYVTSGAGSLDEVMERGFSHEWGGLAGNRELVRWMRAYNADRPASEQLRFAGFDGPLEITHAASPRQALIALYDYLAVRVEADLLPCTVETLDRLLGADDQWTNPAAMLDPSQSVGQTPEATQLRLLADALVALLDAWAPHLTTVSTPQEWERARLFGRTAVSLLRYHHWMADTSPGRMARLLTVRDSLMAANLLALAERGPTLVYAHNAHLQRSKSTIRMGDSPVEWWSAGAIVDTHLGGEYAFLATAVGAIPHRGVDAPPADTVEGMLYALPENQCVVDPQRVVAAVPTPPVPRVSPWFGYAPLDPTQLGTIDGLVFVKDLSRSPTSATSTGGGSHP